MVLSITGAVQLIFNPRERIEGFSEGSVCDHGLLFSTLLDGTQHPYHRFLLDMVHHGGIAGSWNP
tara:strand:- start:714 stop:908 length:195 start_codon:yes stop_codon:yes gene_type:complete